MERVVGLWINKSKPEAQTLALQIQDWFEARGWDVFQTACPQNWGLLLLSKC